VTPQISSLGRRSPLGFQQTVEANSPSPSPDNRWHSVDDDWTFLGIFVLENIAQKGFPYQVAQSNLDSFDEQGEVKVDSILSRETLPKMSMYWKLSEALSM